VRWYNFLTFGVIPDLAFSKPLYCLRDSKQHIWVDLVLGTIKASSSSALRQKYALLHLYERFTHIFKDTRVQRMQENCIAGFNFKVVSDITGAILSWAYLLLDTDTVKFRRANQQAETTAPLSAEPPLQSEFGELDGIFNIDGPTDETGTLWNPSLGNRGLVVTNPVRIHRFDVIQHQPC